ncbi:genomic island protein [Azoarcus indigens]|uniref:Phage P22-like portal protein n=1 Tax=Azoarcus indigens TaxID=29545 RepID=A0A4V3BM52_9RHOO|nr:genomic island protein [Azoarcus indigens]NMG64364.1 genomic island protein [Azoarcus indigens]TDN49182.1 hypothetical protein C7389_11233 [Azoarcus indigens]
MTENDKPAEAHEQDGTQLARENWERYQYCVSRGHRDYTRLASRLEGFYLGGGEQWSREDLEILHEQGRPAYEFNEVMPAINAAVGYQIHNRMDIAFRPRGGDATKELAEVRTKVAKQIADNCRLHWKETEVFGDGMIQQRGFFDVRMGYDDAVLGELSISVLDPLDVMPDPDAKSYDPKDWADVTVSKWLTLDEIEGQYGKDARLRAEGARALGDEDFGEGDDDGTSRNKFGWQDTGRYDAEYAGGGPRRLRVIDRQKRVLSQMQVAIFPGGDVRQLAGDEKPEVLEQLRANGAFITRRMMKRVRWIVSTCDALLHDTWSPYDRFTVVPFFPYFRRGKTRGMVDNAVGPQEALNKAVSQYVHIINTTANSGWAVEQDSLTNMTTEQLEEFGASTGLVVEYATGKRPPQKIQPNQVPAGVDRIIDRAAGTLKEVTVPDAMRGTQGPETSGIAIQSKQFAAQQGLAVPLDNLARTRAMVADWIDYAITKYYDSERVFRITKTDPLSGKEVEEELTINQWVPESGGYLNDMTSGEYDVVVTEQPMQVTFENGQFQQAMEMRGAGVRVPDSVVIRHSNLTDKHEIIQQMEAASATPPDPLAEAEAVLAQARARLAEAQAERARAEAVNKSIEGMFSSAQTATLVAQNPAIATAADGMWKSAGGIDKDAAPAIPSIDAPAVAPPEQNTNPLTPANPSVGMNAGIEGGQP